MTTTNFPDGIGANASGDPLSIPGGIKTGASGTPVYIKEGIRVGSQNRVTETGFETAQFVKVSLGAPEAADTDSLIKAATGTEIPDEAETVTYTTDDIDASPCDGANDTWVLDVPRNIVVTVSHASATIAQTTTVTGTDEYGVAMSEAISTTAGGTSKTGNGKKAFKTVTSIAIAAAEAMTDCTINIGHGDVLGLPLIMAENTVVKELEDGATATAGTVALADTTATATTTTGDVRGTYDPNSACDGSKVFKLIYAPTSLTSNGVTQA